MATPPMLASREPSLLPPPTARRPDPAVAVAVALIGVISVALVLGAVLSVYDWTTPGAVRPLFFATLGVFVTTLAVLVVTAAVRHLRSDVR